MSYCIITWDGHFMTYSKETMMFLGTCNCFPRGVGRKQVGVQGTGPGLWVERKWQEKGHLHHGGQEWTPPPPKLLPCRWVLKVSEVNEGSAGTACKSAVMPLKSIDPRQEI